jgi:hypothetical protein
VTGAVLVPATMATASRHSTAKFPLALVPLQKAQLGAAGRSLKLDYGSGPKFMVDVGLKAFDIRDSGPPVNGDWTRLGRVARYALDYGDSFVGRTGVMEISTGVEQYKSPAAATSGYLLWRFADSFRGQPTGSRLWHRIKVPTVVPRHFAFLGQWHVPHLNPIVGLDEQMLVGRFVLDVTVIAGSSEAAKQAAPRLSRLLYHRLQSMLRGHLVGKAAKLPRKPRPGRAPGGPDLSTMILQPADVGQSNPRVTQNYFWLLPSLSAYGMTMSPAGGVFDDDVEQQIAWWPTATEATYAEAYQYTLSDSAEGGLTPVDLTSVGDNARGSSKYVADDDVWVVISLTNGRASDYLVAHGSGYGPPLTDSDVQSLAQAAANRLDAGLGP